MNFIYIGVIFKIKNKFIGMTIKHIFINLSYIQIHYTHNINYFFLIYKIKWAFYKRKTNF